MAEKLIRITGPVASGKTEHVVRIARDLVCTQNVRAHAIGIIATTPTACQTMHKRLLTMATNDKTEKLNASGNTLQNVHVLTASELYLASLGMKANARAPRLLTAAERTVLIADAKSQDGKTKHQTVESKGSRDEEPQQNAAGDIRQKAARILRERNAVFPEKFAEYVLESLASEEGPFLRGSYDAILIDDAHLLDAASLQVCAQLCSGTLVLADDPAARMSVPHPSQTLPDTRYPIEVLEQEFSEITRINLAERPSFTSAGEALPAMLRFADSLSRHCGCDDASGAGCLPTYNLEDTRSIVSVKWRTPDDEFLGIAKLLKSLIVTDKTLLPSECYIVAPNAVWARNLRKGLSLCGLGASVVMGSPLPSNPRDKRAQPALEAFELLALAASPYDVTAWRTWCALGHPNYCAKEWQALQSWAAETGMNTIDALLSLIGTEIGAENEVVREDLKNTRSDTSVGTTAAKQEPYAGAAFLAARARQARDTAASLRSLRGLSLLNKLSSLGCASLASMLSESITGTENAAELFERALTCTLAPAFDKDPQHVRIGTLREMRGLNPRIVIIAGAVDGLIPSAEANSPDDLRMFYEASGKAQSQLILSSFQKTDAEVAQQLGIVTARTKQENKRLLAMTRRSPFIELAGDAAPGTVSGEQLLGEL